MRRRLLKFLCAGFLGGGSLAMAQTPKAPVPVPSGCAARPDDATVSAKADLDQRRAALMERIDRWKSRGDAFNQKYAGRDFDADSQEAKDGAAEQVWLDKEAENYMHAAEAFKTDVGKFVEVHKCCAQVPGLQSQFDLLTQDINLDRQVVQNFGFDKTVDQIEYWGDLPSRQIEDAKTAFRSMLFDATLGTASEAAGAVGSLTPDQVDALNRLAGAEGEPPLGIVAGARNVHDALEFLDKSKRAYEAADARTRGRMLEAAVALGGLASENHAFGLLLTADGWAAFEVYQSVTAVKTVQNLTKLNEGDLILLKSRSEKLARGVNQLIVVKKHLAEMGANCDSTSLVPTR